MKNKIMLGLVTLVTCLSLASCGESEEKKNNEMEEIAFSMASAKCDEYFENRTNYRKMHDSETEIIVDKQLIVRNIEDNSSFYMWFRLLTFPMNGENILCEEELKFIALASWEDKEVKIDECGGSDLSNYERYI